MRNLTYLNPDEIVYFLTQDGRIIRRSTLNRTLSKRKKIRSKVLKQIQNAIKRARREGFLYLSYHLPWKKRHKYIKRIGPYKPNKMLVPLVQKERKLKLDLQTIQKKINRQQKYISSYIKSFRLDLRKFLRIKKYKDYVNIRILKSFDVVEFYGELIENKLRLIRKMSKSKWSMEGSKSKIVKAIVEFIKFKSMIQGLAFMIKVQTAVRPYYEFLIRFLKTLMKLLATKIPTFPVKIKAKIKALRHQKLLKKKAKIRIHTTKKSDQTL